MEEARKFLDLDMMAEQIRDVGDQAMFREAVQCYHIGSYRAAVILVWISTTNCLYRFLERLHNEGDGTATQAFRVVSAQRDTSSYEQTLIDQCKMSELLSDYEARCLTFIRDTRNKCAHPSEVKLSAEAVRYVLVTCAEVVLCRREYRGKAFIEDIVTTQFHDHNFLSNEQHASEYCRSMIARVPRHLLHLFVRVAAEKNSTATPEIWQQNARRFFKVLLEECNDDGILEKIASASRLFEKDARDFAALFIGLNQRALPHWDEQKRGQARATLRELPPIKQRPEHVEAWAIICEHDGLSDMDKTFLRERLVFVTAHLPPSFVNKWSADLLKILADVAADNIDNEQAASVLLKPFVTSLGNSPNDQSERLVRQIIERYPTSDRYREVLETVNTWSDGLIVQFLKLTDRFLLGCTEDNPEDVNILFVAASELVDRLQLHTPLEFIAELIPSEFTEVITATLMGRVQPEWKEPISEIGDRFKFYLERLLTRHPAPFTQLREQHAELIARYREPDAGPFDE